MKKIISLSLILLGFVSCSHEEEKSSENKPVVVEEIKDKDTSILGGYASFEVEVTGSPYSITDISNNAYRKSNGNYGFTPFIDFEINDDNTIDVLWLDKKATTNAGRNITRISLDNKNLLENIIVPEVCNVKGSRFLGFCSLKNNEFVVGHSRKLSPSDPVDSVAVYTKFDKLGGIKFSATAFGAKENKYNPGQASTSNVVYNKGADALGVYLGHNAGGHQGGWIGFINNASINGDLFKNSQGKKIGDGWYYSHNFDQRIMVSSDNKFYTLAHGDAYSRALEIAKWSQTKGKEGNSLKYFDKIPGTSGDNNTGTRTGNFLELPNGNVAIVYSTEHSRVKRDLKIVIVSGMKTDNPQIVKETWITNNTENLVGWGMNLSLFGDNKILVGWNEFKDGVTPVGSRFITTDFEGNILTKAEESKETLFNHAQAMKRTKDGKKVVFVSAGSGNKLKINTINIK